MTTFKELFLKEYPGKIDRVKKGEMWGCPCPYDYGYETEEESHKNCKIRGGKGCNYCWNREIPKDGPTYLPENYFEQSRVVKKNYNLFYKFIQSKGLCDDYERWLKREQGRKYTEKLQDGDDYYIVSEKGDVICSSWRKGFDDYLFGVAPLWKSKEDAEKYLALQTYLLGKTKL